MYELAPGYLVELARQMAFVSAFQGGLSGIFLQMLLPAQGPRRLTTVAVGFAASAGVLFIICLVASTMLTSVLHPEAPAFVGDPAGIQRARAIGFLGFMLGLHCLLACIGLSGWVRSRATGWTTSIAAGVGADFVTWGAAGF